MTVVPLASTARAHEVLGRADAREFEDDDARPRAGSRGRATKPCSTSTSAPIASRPRRCMSTLRLPMLSPPGNATRASPQRASSGPSTLNDAAHLRHELVRRLGVQLAGRVDAYFVARRAARPRRRSPRSSSAITSRSSTDRHVAQRRDARREQRGGHLLGARVLRRAGYLDAAVERTARPHAERAS